MVEERGAAERWDGESLSQSGPRLLNKGPGRVDMARREGAEGNSDAREGGAPSPADGRERGYAFLLRISEAERRLMKERIAEADEGVFILSGAMNRCIESWGAENELPPPKPDIFPKPRRS